MNHPVWLFLLVVLWPLAAMAVIGVGLGLRRLLAVEIQIFLVVLAITMGPSLVLRS